MSRVRRAVEMGDLAQAAAWEAEACERDGYDVTAELLTRLARERDEATGERDEAVRQRDGFAASAVAQAEDRRVALAERDEARDALEDVRPLIGSCSCTHPAYGLCGVCEARNIIGAALASSATPDGEQT